MSYSQQDSFLMPPIDIDPGIHVPIFKMLCVFAILAKNNYALK